MEALRTQLDSLNWELQRLQVENRKLREEHPEAAERIDQEEEVASAREAEAAMTERVQRLEEQLAGRNASAAESERRATDAQREVLELSARLEALVADQERDGRNATTGATAGTATLGQLEEALQARRDRVRELEAALTEAEAGRGAAAMDREADRERMELEHYRSRDAERRQWEAREARMLSSLERAEEELQTARTTTADGEDTRLRSEVETLKAELETVQSVLSGLNLENNQLVQENEKLAQENENQRRGIRTEPPPRCGAREDSILEERRAASRQGAADLGTARDRIQARQTTPAGSVTSGGPNPQTTRSEGWGSPQPTYGGEGTGVAVGNGGGGGGARENCGGEDAYTERNNGGATPVTDRNTARPSRVDPGGRTWTSLSSNHPRVVSFSGPVTAAVTRNPTRSQSVSGVPTSISTQPGGVSVRNPPQQPPALDPTSMPGNLRGQPQWSNGESTGRVGMVERSVGEIGVRHSGERDAERWMGYTQPQRPGAQLLGSGMPISGTSLPHCALSVPTHPHLTQGRGVELPSHTGQINWSNQMPFSHHTSPPETYTPTGQYGPPVANGAAQPRGVPSPHPASAHQPGGSGVAQNQPATPRTAPVARRTMSPVTTSTVEPPTSFVGVVPLAPASGRANGSGQRPQPSTAMTMPVPFCTMPMVGQIPRISRFTGEGRAVGESFKEWYEHFENVARLTGWDDQWKLAHLTSNLEDTALAYYRSCSAEVRGQYPALVAALERRFTPVRLTAVQAQLFHTRQQQDQETVDQFAQELQKLYNLAYAGATSEGPQAERMGQTLLTNQFITGLRPNLKQKLIGVEGRFEEMVLKARFEEAKTREFVLERPRNAAPTKTQRQPTSVPTPISQQPPASSFTPPAPTSDSHPRARGGPKCYACGMEGHISRSCPYPKEKQGSESKGRRTGVPHNTISALVGENDAEDRMSELTRRLEKMEKKFAPETATLNTMTAESGGNKLGPSVTARVYVNGQPTQALIDTGSPATVVSLDFVLATFAKGKKNEQTPSEWKEEVQEKFSLPSVTLKAYSGHQLDIQYQVCVELTHGDQTLDTVVLVQGGAPHDLLLGTDLQPKLGFALVATDGNKLTDLLTGKEHSCSTHHNSCGNRSRPHKEGPNDNLGNSSTGDHSLTPLELSSAGGPTKDGDSQLDHDGTDGESTPSEQPEAAERRSIEQTGVVRLLTAVRVPPGYMKTVRTQVSGVLDNSLLLFTPDLSEQHVLLPEAAIERGDHSEAVLVVLNRGMEPIHLPKGKTLGTVVQVEEVMKRDRPEEGLVCGMGGECDRTRRLQEQLELNLEHLTPAEKNQTLRLIASYSDTFALDACELGTTTLVQHAINTGDHSPIRQQLRRMPFALRQDVDRLVGEMLDQGVIQPSSSPWASPVVLVRKKDGGPGFAWITGA